MKHNLFCFLVSILVNLLYYVQNTTTSPIINGMPDEHHLFKFHVSIHKKKGPRNEYVYACGGSIISERYILTVAHCLITIENNVVRETFYPLGRTKVIAGTNHINGPGIERDLIRAFIPLEHTTGSIIHADIAVAELSVDLPIHLYPDKLAIMPLEVLDPRSNAAVNHKATFCGFGHDIFEEQRNGKFYPEKSNDSINKFMNVRILGSDECPTFETSICVRNDEPVLFRTACYGDSGSGLIYLNKIVGVLSHGPPNCNTLAPVVFTRLNGYMRFIEKAQKPRGDHRNMYVLDKKPESSENPKSPHPNDGLRTPKSPYPNDGSSSSSAGGKKKGFWPFQNGKNYGGPA